MLCEDKVKIIPTKDSNEPIERTIRMILYLEVLSSSNPKVKIPITPKKTATLPKMLLS
jgi:hypothetical protein